MPVPIPFEPNPTQAKFIYDLSQYTALYGGVGNGKTTAGCIKMQMLMDIFPGNMGLVGRLTYPELRDTTMREYLDVARERNGGTLEPGPYIKRWQKADMVLEMQNDSVVVFRYLENYESILSMNLGAFYVDQAEFIPEKTYLALESRLRFWGRKDGRKLKEWREWHLRKFGTEPKFTPREMGFITGNPGPGWVFERYKRNTSGLYKMYEASTSENRANLPANYEENLRRSYNADYVRRFLDGDWSVMAGMVYKSYSTDLHLVNAEETRFWKVDANGEGRLEMPAHYPVFVGMDTGQRNPTAVEGFAVDEDGNLIFYLEHYKVSAVIKEHADALKVLFEGHNVPRAETGEYIVWIDPAVSGDSDPHTGRNFKQLYAEQGIAGMNANKAVLAGIAKVEQMLAPDQTHLYPKWHPRAGQPGSPRMFIMKGYCPALQHEFPLYRWEEKRNQGDQNEIEKPRKYLDHALDAARYGIMAYFDQKAEVAPTYREPTYDEWVLQTSILGKGDGPW